MLLAVDKEKWITSFDVIRKLKKHFPPKTKIWHSGTLDPMATWLMLIGIYKEWTKMLHQLQWLDKRYITTIDFSKMSDTRDMDYWDFFEQYQIKEEKNVKKAIFVKENLIQKPDIQQIINFLDKLSPSCEIPLTPFSAKKKNWQKMYDLARSWKPILENKIMITNGYKILNYDFPELQLEFDVWSWTYIRSLWYWLWLQFWLGWILTSLRRISIWDYDLSKIDFKEQFGVKSCILID